MEVILLERLGKLGTFGQTVKVKDGYGRNYLIPQGKALRATEANKKQFEARRAEIEKADAKKREDAEGVARSLDKLIVTLIMQAGEDGRLFGSVNARKIAQAVTEQAHSQVGHQDVVPVNAIKYLGVHPVNVLLHADVKVQVHVNVARSESEAQEAEREFLNPTQKKNADAEDAEANEGRPSRKKKKGEAEEAAPEGEEAAA
ncbi:MAG: ribosomal protein [Rickettsiales bacterium]|jgi:large subunit ribosomal protein L9|nr:ribosomal protein [Rickettsiales bacterium]